MFSTMFMAELVLPTEGLAAMTIISTSLNVGQIVRIPVSGEQTIGISLESILLVKALSLANRFLERDETYTLLHLAEGTNPLFHVRQKVIDITLKVIRPINNSKAT